MPSEMDFGEALTALNMGLKVGRAGWNGKDQWLGLSSDVRLGTVTMPFIYLHTAQGETVPWTASQTDMLAKDWRTVDVEEDLQ